MTAPAGSEPESGNRPGRPATIDAVAAILVFGGLFGGTQLLAGDFVITGSLPAKGPILGVAAILYGASVVLGVLLRTGRAWFPGVNLAGLFAVLYLAAFGHAVALLLGIAHLVAAVLLVRARPWFVQMGRSRSEGAASAPTPPTSGRRADQPRAPASEGRGRKRPSSRR